MSWATGCDDTVTAINTILATSKEMGAMSCLSNTDLADGTP